MNKIRLFIERSCLSCVSSMVIFIAGFLIWQSAIAGNASLNSELQNQRIGSEILIQLEQEIGKTLKQVNLNQIGRKDLQGGYAVDKQGRVVGLNLNETQLASIPDTVFSLKYLQKLSLVKNQLQELPDTFTQLHNLVYLDVRYNELQDLPTSLGQVKSLKFLYLGHNRLQDLPISFAQLQNLEILGLGKNQLQKIPTSVSLLENLSRLYLHENQLRTLPTWLGQLQNLTILGLQKNQLQALPESIGQLKSLQKLYLNDNDLEELPTSFSQLKKLQLARLDSNQLFDLPEEILNLNLNILWKTGKIKQDITVGNNPLVSPSPEIIQQGQQAIQDYFKVKPIIYMAIYSLTGLKTPMEEYLTYKGKWPDSAKAMGFNITNPYMESINIDPLTYTCTLTIKNQLGDASLTKLIGGKTMQISFDIKTQSWKCGSGQNNPIDTKYLPSLCRS
ncbi:leucine-rich repeat domain-containing protein [Candidatus Albibeggiatoa sp. nov. NOAA]|uniref:leucine-rich repeat domain-containing protein n=1 Tax=Candidatus Albibeggiatoa sp. nov. NOAA TaxID=3162724 RepID=UPI0032F243CD|nr:leucine-rich repeat domain-containing protein [Thiotrichaceae bacterium]